MKRTTSRSQETKVVPFSLEPDLDESDPQPGPSHLHIFKPAVLQEPPNVLPGCCNWELEDLEDPVDPQKDPPGVQLSAPEDPPDVLPGCCTSELEDLEDPSGLYPAAPEDPADHRPGLFNREQIPLDTVLNLVC